MKGGGKMIKLQDLLWNVALMDKEKFKQLESDIISLGKTEKIVCRNIIDEGGGACCMGIDPRTGKLLCT